MNGLAIPNRASAKVEYRTVAATMEHALAIARTVREADADEIKAMSGRNVFHAMIIGLQLSDAPQTWLADDVPLCMFGISPRSRVYGTGTPWLIGSYMVSGHERAFLRHSKPIFQAQAHRFSELENHVDARNTLTLRWLRWLGFTIEPAEPFGEAGLPFHRFHMKA